jgi:glycosyltransferase involved in cell wall biosynthesis
MDWKQMRHIAVLIPSYKPKEYLKDCLSSLDKQSLSKEYYRVYIALNGPKSTYEEYVLSILKSMTFEYKYMYIEQANVSNARNRLIEESTEEFIAFIDDDDIVSEDYLESLWAVATREDISISNIYYFRKDIRFCEPYYIGSDYDSLSGKESSKLKTRKYFSSVWATLIHREIIGETRFDKRLKNGEDSLFMATISRNISGICKTTKNTKYYVRKREGSAQTKNRSLSEKVNTFLYLQKSYSKLLLDGRYERMFILSRIAASVKKFFKDILGI